MIELMGVLEGALGGLELYGHEASLRFCGSNGSNLAHWATWACKFCWEFICDSFFLGGCVPEFWWVMRKIFSPIGDFEWVFWDFLFTWKSGGLEGLLFWGFLCFSLAIWGCLLQGKVKDIELKGHADSVDQLCWDPKHADLIATASGDKTVRLWDARSKWMLFS